MDDQYLTVEELSQKIKFSKQTIYNLICKKEFVLKKHYLKPLPKKILFIWSAVKDWMENPHENENNPAPQTESPHNDNYNQKTLINI